MGDKHHHYEQISLTDDQVEELRKAGNDLNEKLAAILTDEVSEWGHLADWFVTPNSRYSLDDESAEVELVEMYTRERGKLYITFTQSAHWGCRDMDDLGDQQSGTLMLEVDLESGCLRVGGEFEVNEASTVEEF